MEEDIHNVSEQFDVILTNPPFGGKEGKHIQQNFPVQSRATELLFLEHIMKKLKMNGRCGMVVPEGTLFRSDAFALVKKDLLERFNVHSIVSLPAGVFLPYSGVKADLIFFDKSGPTSQTWYYELIPPNGSRYTKGRPIQDSHLNDCRQKLRTREASDHSWIVPVSEIIRRGYDMTARNPTQTRSEDESPASEVVAAILEKERRVLSIVEEISKSLDTNRPTRNGEQ